MEPEEGKDEYEVIAVTGKEAEDGRVYYETYWGEKYNDEALSGEPEANLKNAREAVARYEARVDERNAMFGTRIPSWHKWPRLAAIRLQKLREMRESNLEKDADVSKLKDAVKSSRNRHTFYGLKDKRGTSLRISQGSNEECPLMMRRLSLLFSLIALALGATKTDDEIKSLPGLTFDVSFKQYSGYLDAAPGNHLHYWLVEAQSNPTQAPIVLWLNGGPGCSSLGGLLTENGPFRPAKDGLHLVENPYAWNKIANVLYIESPRNVGFSYRDDGHDADRVYNDDKTAADLVLALKDFFRAYPEYLKRDFYVTAESYGGVYIPTLVDALIKEIQADANVQIAPLKGFAVGNGEFNIEDQINSAINLLYFRGILGKDEFDSLFNCCQKVDPDATQFVYCKFTNMVTLDEHAGATPKNYTDPELQRCAEQVVEYGINQVWHTSNDVYNTYQDCYADGQYPPSSHHAAAQRTFANYEEPFIDQGSLQNDGSTDAQQGFQCYMDDATQTYLQLPEVRAALHIPEAVHKWENCKAAVGVLYSHQHNDMGSVFDSIAQSGYPIRMLLFNGDVDMACEFLGDQWFIERFVERNEIPTAHERASWNYRKQNYLPRSAGYAKRFQKENITVDLLTVKGAGHFVPTDRPGPALQMINNFFFQRDYSLETDIDTNTRPLLKEFEQVPLPLSRKEADRIFDLPGLTYQINFNQFAGYLNGVPGNKLHYWFVESQSNPSNDPLVLWLTGGPGCSAYTALLTENGPFHPNRDGQTLYENVYSWNKLANVLYIESPRQVGFSDQDTSVNPDEVYDDDRSAYDIYLALRDFLEVYPEYIDRKFFITGESYAGIYIPTTASLLIDKITSGELKGLRLEGLAIGNGQLSNLQQVNSAIQNQYFHGTYGKDDWDALQECCPKSEHPGDAAYFEFCDYTKHIIQDEHGNVHPKDPRSHCGRLVAKLSQRKTFNGQQEVYNMYQSCYEPGQAGNVRPNLKKANYKKNFVDQAILVSHESSDSQDGFLCWGQNAMINYLNLLEVQAALHTKENFTGQWNFCTDGVASVYTHENNDTTPYFNHIYNKGYPIRILIYNGDVDNACNFLGDEWFIDNFVGANDIPASGTRDPWTYQTQISGYTQRYQRNNFTLDVLTMKGAGHFVPSDRPGPALQMIAAFINNQPYSTRTPSNTDLTPLSEVYQAEEIIGQQDSIAARAKRSIAEDTAEMLMNADTIKLKAEAPVPGSKDADKVTALPGLTFDFAPNQYSGYLNPAGTQHYLHYWLIESETDADTRPLLLWLNGGPGCSSLLGMMTENGPFLNNRDGETLYENVFSWHKVANVLYLESPVDVGFSYTLDENPQYGDDETAAQNVGALIAFLDRYPEYKNRQLFLSGESYGGVYLPTFTDLLLRKMIEDPTLAANVNLQGVAIGNGLLSMYQQINSAVSLTYFKGITSRTDYQALAKCVPSSWNGPMAYFDWTRTYLNLDQSPSNVAPKNNDTSTLEGWCGAQIIKLGSDAVWLSGNQVYNTYEDCYVTNPLPEYPGASYAAESDSEASQSKRAKRDIGRPLAYEPFIDEAKRMNYFATDSNGGFDCYNGIDKRFPYLNRPEVRKAMHISDSVPLVWQQCSPKVRSNYVKKYFDTTDVFKSIFNSTTTLNRNIRFLIYNGDADMACQFLGDQWFIEALAKDANLNVTKQRSPWDYVQNQYSSHKFPIAGSGETLGGYVKSFVTQDARVIIDQLTVKGAGHMVPMDRPGPMLQTIYNFVHALPYNSTLESTAISIERTPLKSDYLGASVVLLTRRIADQILAPLPGMTFTANFNQFSGYLQASRGNKLFYWLVEAQDKDAQVADDTPLVLWLNGGPGCSSMGGLLQEHGPFRPNPDGRTLFENAYSWNKAAHVLYIDSPRLVGFSYQDKSQSNDTEFNDDKTIADLVLALDDFFSVYPYMKTKDFYTAGESYGGVYIPLLTSQLATNIKAGLSDINLKGMAVGNGFFSQRQASNSNPAFHYFHGQTDKKLYDSLQQCCTNDDQKKGLYCDYYQYEEDDDAPQNKQCVDRLTIYDASRGLLFGRRNDVYNMYQDCYTSTTPGFGSAAGRDQMMSLLALPGTKGRMQENYDDVPFIAQPGQLDPESTDSQGGFQCFMTDATLAYMTQASVRTALHVPKEVQEWELCKDVGYENIYDDMSDQFKILLESGLNLRVLVYNGDVDTVCSFMLAQWFIEQFSADNALEESEHSPWLYRTVHGGYKKRFTRNDGDDIVFTLDLLTVKGAGHMVPIDRPGPALQMVGAFLRNEDYDTPIPYPLERKELLPQYRRVGVPSDDTPSNTTTSSSTTQSTTTLSTTTASTTSASTSTKSTTTQSTSTKSTTTTQSTTSQSTSTRSTSTQSSTKSSTTVSSTSTGTTTSGSTTTDPTTTGTTQSSSTESSTSTTPQTTTKSASVASIVASLVVTLIVTIM